MTLTPPSLDTAKGYRGQHRLGHVTRGNELVGEWGDTRGLPISEAMERCLANRNLRDINTLLLAHHLLNVENSNFVVNF